MAFSYKKGLIKAFLVVCPGGRKRDGVLFIRAGQALYKGGEKCESAVIRSIKGVLTALSF